MWNVGGTYVCYETKKEHSQCGTLNIINVRNRMISRYNTPKGLVRPIQNACGTYGRFDRHGKTFLLLIDGVGRLWSTGDHEDNFSDITPPQITRVEQVAISGTLNSSLLFIGVDSEGKSALFSRELIPIGEITWIPLDGSCCPVKLYVLQPPRTANFRAVQMSFVTTTDGSIHQIKEENPGREPKHKTALVTKLCSLIMKHTMNDLKCILWKDYDELVILCEDHTCKLLKLPTMMVALGYKESLMERALGYVGISPNTAQSSLFEQHPRVRFASHVNHALVFCDDGSHSVSFVSLKKNNHWQQLNEHIDLVNIAPITHSGYSALMIDTEGQLYTLSDDLNVNPLDIPNLKERDEFSVECALQQGRQKGILPSIVRKSVANTQ